MFVDPFTIRKPTEVLQHQNDALQDPGASRLLPPRKIMHKKELFQTEFHVFRACGRTTHVAYPHGASTALHSCFLICDVVSSPTLPKASVVRQNWFSAQAP